MEHLIDKDAVVAEIDKRLQQLTDAALDSMMGRNLIEIRELLDTLEVKEVDLEKESLTWKDIHNIVVIEDKLIHELCVKDGTLPSTKEFYQEILKRFNELWKMKK